MTDDERAQLKRWLSHATPDWATAGCLGAGLCIIGLLAGGVIGLVVGWIIGTVFPALTSGKYIQDAWFTGADIGMKIGRYLESCIFMPLFNIRYFG
jgi:hypothetical protein